MPPRQDTPANDDEHSSPPRRPWGDDGDGGSFGAWLRQQREIRNITLREISDSTKIGLRYLKALEEDRFELLPASVFTRGFLREYAKYVGLDPDEVVNFYLVATGSREDGKQDEEEVEEQRDRDDRSSRRIVVVVAVLVLLLLAVLGAAALLQRDDGSEAPETRPAMAPPVTPPAPAPTEVPEPEGEAAPLEVTLSFTDECWVEAVVDDEERISELRVQGESMQIEARERVVLTLGNPEAVRIDANGTSIPVAGEPGRVLRDVVIDLDTVAALRDRREGP